MNGYNISSSIVDPVYLSTLFKTQEKYNDSYKLINVEDLTKHLRFEKLSQSSEDKIVVICSTTRRNRIENEAFALFGTMRNASVKERESVEKYIKSISKPTGLNFFDIC
jgi:DNA repair protein RadC